MRDIADGVQAGHVLLLQEVDRMAFAFGKYRNKDICPRNLVPTGTLNVIDRPLNDALETCRRLGVIATVDDQVG